MYPLVVFASHVTFMAEGVRVVCADQLLPPSTDETKPTSSWHVEALQFAFG
jgi:hypothetical protein